MFQFKEFNGSFCSRVETGGKISTVSLTYIFFKNAQKCPVNRTQGLFLGFQLCILGRELRLNHIKSISHLDSFPFRTGMTSHIPMLQLCLKYL